jgi:hypothetical protein
MLTNGHTTAPPTTIILIDTRFVPRTSLNANKTSNLQILLSRLSLLSL